MNNIFVDLNYITIISPYLHRFKIKNHNPHLSTFRCPYCNDSRKNTKKTRGYLYQIGDNINYKCHNCGKSTSFNNFLYDIDVNIHSEYRMAKFVEGKEKVENNLEELLKKTTQIPQFKSESKIVNIFKDLKKISQLDHNHEAKKYIQSRHIPNPYHAKLYYTNNFFKWVNTILPNKFEDKLLKYDHGRIVIPFFNEKKECFAFQGRALNDTYLRYITIKLDSSMPKIFGLDTIDKSKAVIIVEGPFDSMFIENSLAVGGGDLLFVEKFGIDNRIFCWDNEPRNIEIIKKMEAAIEAGERIIIWPEWLEEKDVNNIILKYPQIDINKLLADNTYKDLLAKLKFTKWRKI